MLLIFHHWLAVHPLLGNKYKLHAHRFNVWVRCRNTRKDEGVLAHVVDRLPQSEVYYVAQKLYHLGISIVLNCMLINSIICILRGFTIDDLFHIISFSLMVLCQGIIKLLLLLQVLLVMLIPFLNLLQLCNSFIFLFNLQIKLIQIQHFLLNLILQHSNILFLQITLQMNLLQLLLKFFFFSLQLFDVLLELLIENLVNFVAFLVVKFIVVFVSIKAGHSSYFRLIELHGHERLFFVVFAFVHLRFTHAS